MPYEQDEEAVAEALARTKLSTGATLVVDGANWQQRGPSAGGTFTPVRDQMGYLPFGETAS